MKRALKIFLLVSITVLMTGCKLAVMVVEGGEVQSNSSGTCLGGTICIIDVTDPRFFESFTAVPDAGWYFKKWNSGEGFFCAGSSSPTCNLSFQEYEGSKEVEEMVASSKVFYLMPIFKNSSDIVPFSSKDIVLVNGKQWLQPALFFNLSWDQINAVCPAGVCGDTGTLNGYDMTGWRWASADDVKALFNVYIGRNALGPETDRYLDYDGRILERFFMSGWRPTFEGWQIGGWIFEWRAMLRDIRPYGIAGRYAGSALIFTNGEERPEFHTAEFIVDVSGSVDDSPRTGAAFYR